MNEENQAESSPVKCLYVYSYILLKFKKRRKLIAEPLMGILILKIFLSLRQEDQKFKVSICFIINSRPDLVSKTITITITITNLH